MGLMEGGHTSFIIYEDKKAPKLHFAFRAKSIRAVQAFYKAAIKAGATDNGPPGFRPDYGPNYYAAFVHSPGGHNIEACYFGARAPKKKR